MDLLRTYNVLGDNCSDCQNELLPILRIYVSQIWGNKKVILNKCEILCVD